MTRASVTARNEREERISTPHVSPFPSVDRIARSDEASALIGLHGRSQVVAAIRATIDEMRNARVAGAPTPGHATILAAAEARLAAMSAPALRRVLNLTGTVLHTNLGRAILPEAAIDHACMAMREACNLEYDLANGKRGTRDDLVEELLTELTGAEAATVVNNNAAAVLLVLAALAGGREVVLSRGELIEIGGAFRIPDVMRSAGARLVEVGTTNRTHARDYSDAIGPDTAALMKVHPSNYAITGFTAAVAEQSMAEIAHAQGVPLIVDLGSGSLIDLSAHGLPHEPIVRETIAAGADIVTFSGDKLLGGPQAGLIVGRRELIGQINRHPLKRALRVSKITLAALEGTLLAYRRPDRLPRDLPTLRLLTRPAADIEALARRLLPGLADAIGAAWHVSVVAVASQVGSGSLPLDILPSAALALDPAGGQSGGALDRLASRLRALPVPIIGRIADGRLLLDLRCLEDESAFCAQMAPLARAMTEEPTNG